MDLKKISDLFLNKERLPEKGNINNKCSMSIRQDRGFRSTNFKEIQIEFY